MSYSFLQMLTGWSEFVGLRAWITNLNLNVEQRTYISCIVIIIYNSSLYQQFPHQYWWWASFSYSLWLFVWHGRLCCIKPWSLSQALLSFSCDLAMNCFEYIYSVDCSLIYQPKPEKHFLHIFSWLTSSAISASAINLSSSWSSISSSNPPTCVLLSVPLLNLAALFYHLYDW